MTTTQSTTAATHEIAYRIHGEEWKRKTFRTEAQLDRWLDQHGEDCSEVRFADDNGGDA